MGCNCRKNRPPLGSNKKKREEAKGKTQQFTLLRKDGTKATFGSFLEANAERVRGGGGTVRPG